MPTSVTINPSRVATQGERDLVHQVLASFPGTRLFIPNKWFSVAEYRVRFTHSLIKLAVHQNTPCYGIVSHKPSGKGATGTVYSIPVFVVVSPNVPFQYIKPVRPLIIKIQSCVQAFEDKFRQNVMHEYKYTVKAGHLAIEKPIFISSGDRLIAAMAMERKPGVELFDFLTLLFPPYQKKITCYLRFMLVCELFSSFNKYVSGKQILHGDLKPENIIFDLVNISYTELSSNNELNNKNFVPDMHMNIIDYGVSNTIGDYRKKVGGTLGYAAPEMIWLQQAMDARTITLDELPVIDSHAADIFSLGKIMAIFFGIPPAHTISLDDSAFQAFIEKEQTTTFASEPDRFASDLLLRIYAILAGMTHPDPVQRWTLNQSIAAFEQVMKDYNYLSFVGRLPEAPRLPVRSDSVMEMQAFINLDNGASNNNNSTRHISPTSVIEGMERMDVIQVARQSPVPLFFKPVPSGLISPQAVCASSSKGCCIIS